MERALMWRRPTRAAMVLVGSSALSCSMVQSPCRSASRAFVEHSTDPKKWRSPENDDVRSQYRKGVPLNSGYAEVLRRAEIERKLVEEDKFTDWYAWYTVGAGCALFLLFLNLIVEYVEPEPSPEYVPYEKKVKEKV